jgi:ABC-type branched-subunit amino acid transport system ATPase component
VSTVEPALSTHELTVRFGGVTAVDGLSADFPANRLTGIIGPNGAGKTTLIDAVSGLVASSGDIRLAGGSIAGWRPHRRAKAGIGRTFQGLELFDEFTVRENLLIPAEANRGWSLLKDLMYPRAGRETEEQVSRALERVGLADRAEVRPPELSLGDRKLVSIARALASGGNLLLLDEPAAGLNSEEGLELGKTLRGLIDSGITIALIDHDMGLVLSVCDLIYVLDFGKLIACGTPEEIRNDEKVIDAYLGQESNTTDRAVAG